ncbi:hypothetical protein [uncultured Duncaniella sp.]|uniref:hypothetical protein n=1 Tax=uncultured Duncaniella sp. TaxID=2768039 RepID=UPI0025A96061|nr:hypothetical protein [uncultured Duncaniella sp.]
MARKTLTSGLLGTVTGLSKEGEPENYSAPNSSDKSQEGLNPGSEVIDKRKPGRPKVGGEDVEVNVTFRLPDSLIQEVRMLAVVERTTQKEIVIAALREYLTGKADNK